MTYHTGVNTVLMQANAYAISAIFILNLLQILFQCNR